MTTAWQTIFQPVNAAREGIKPRAQQQVMGQAIIDALDSGTNILCEAPTGTGKSLAALIPIIARAGGEGGYRAVISTATKSLQDQYMEDLDSLYQIYNRTFTYRSLKGRDSYICFNAFKQNSRGNAKMTGLLRTLDGQRGALGDGERGDVERVLRYELDDYEWSFMSGSSKRCGENSCTQDECYSARARNLAASANIVITNNAILRVDADSRGEDAIGDAFLGDVDAVVVDEAHLLADSLIEGWTEEFTEWELTDLMAKVLSGISQAQGHVNDDGVGYRANKAADGLADFLSSVIRFYGELHSSEEWNQVSDALCLKYVSGGATQMLINAMRDYEENSADRISYALKVLEEVVEYLKQTMDYMAEGGIRGIRKVSKGRTAAKNLISVLDKIMQALPTKNGVIVDYGVPYSVIVDGIIKRSGQHAVKISVVPMDISSKAASIWKDRTSVLMSATMKDLATGDFRYIKTSLGFESARDLSLDTVFDVHNRQLTYVTPGASAGYGELVDVPGARYNRQEMLDLIHAAKGRSLVLFTARKELDDAADYFQDLKNRGEFPYRLLVQTRDANKARLSEEFSKDENSVLLATKSYFQGANFPGSTLSLVIIAKYPLPQYNILCKNQIEWWRQRGFPQWYASKSMEIFHQASGRVLRTESDFGVVALIDQRVADPSQRVCETALQAVATLGSPVIRDVREVERFLSIDNPLLV